MTETPAYDTYLGQILHDGKWLDYARGTEEQSRTWFLADTANRRVVDWIRKDRILFGGTSLDNCPTCGRRITDFDPDGCELDSGQRSCLSHLSDEQRASLEAPNV